MSKHSRKSKAPKRKRRWIKKAIKPRKKGLLHRQMGVAVHKKLTIAQLRREEHKRVREHNRARTKTVRKSALRKLQRVRLAISFRGMKHKGKT